MLEQIETQIGSKFEFTFSSGEHAGEHYSVELGFCPNPVCQCGIISMSVLVDGTENSETTVPSLEFSVDVLKKDLDTYNEDASRYNQNFGKAFVHYLTDEDWLLLTDALHSYKRQISDETPDEELDTQFPADEIERSGTMVGYNKILPYAEYKVLEIEDRDYILDGQYCVKPLKVKIPISLSLSQRVFPGPRYTVFDRIQTDLQLVKHTFSALL